MRKFPSQRAKQFVVRMSDDLHAELKASALANRRSLNSEILIRLEEPRPAVLAAVSGDLGAQLGRDDA